MFKNCQQCKKEVKIKPYREGTFKFCSHACRHDSMRERTPWNKGTKGLMGPNVKGGFKKGTVPWNKKVWPSCVDCGKESYWIKTQTRCHKCWLKSWNDKANHPRWIEDRSKLKYLERTKRVWDGKFSEEYKTWMLSVKRRDGWKCMITNQDCKGRLEAHHILRWTEYPELRFDLNNGITLCHFHHPRRREDEKRLRSEFQALVSVSKV